MSSVIFNESNDTAQAESALTTLGAVVLQPFAVRIAAHRGRAHAQQAAHLLQSQLRIQEAADQLRARFLEVAGVIVRGDFVGEEGTKEVNLIRQRLQVFAQIVV